MQQSMPEGYYRESSHSEKDLMCAGSMARPKSLALMYPREGMMSESPHLQRGPLLHQQSGCGGGLGNEQGKAVISVKGHDRFSSDSCLLAVFTNVHSLLLKKAFNALNHSHC